MLYESWSTDWSEGIAGGVLYESWSEGIAGGVFISLVLGNSWWRVYKSLGLRE